MHRITGLGLLIQVTTDTALTLYMYWRTRSKFLTLELRGTGLQDRNTERAFFHTLTYLTMVEDDSEDHQSPEEDTMEISKFNVI